MVETAAELGADRVINHKEQDFVDAVLDATDNLGVDVVLDTVGGDLLERSIRVTKPFGRLAGIVSTNAGFKSAFIKNLTVHTVFLQRDRMKLKALRDLIEREQLRPVIDEVRPLTEVADAHRRLAEGGVSGKIVLDVSGS
jgi:NADPH:quinone reductase-like Zn-dependent oxidoreductase